METIYGYGWSILFLLLLVLMPRGRGGRRTRDHVIACGIVALAWPLPAAVILAKRDDVLPFTVGDLA